MATRRPRYHRASRAPVRPPLSYTVSNWIMTVASIAMVVIVGYLAWPALLHNLQAGTVSAPPTAAPAGNVGGQAPPAVRGTNPEPAAPRAIVSTPIPGIAQNEAESLRMYQATAQVAPSAPQSEMAAPSTPQAAPLPQNSAGEPVIDAVQQQQLDMSAQMAADEQQAAILAAQLADAASRAPDVSKEEAEQMMHRDLCSVPRANPHTCDRGLFKPTPVQP
jgi:hypothetical protein